jgi:uncharacterized RDD family membrane protein YckC
VGYVSVGRRFVALLIDFIIIGLVSAPFSDYRYENGTVSFHSQGTGFLLTQVGWILYFVIMEGAFGATVGKFALGIRVVKLDGSKVDWGSAIVRTVLRIIDGFPYIIPYLVGAILVWSSPMRQRLGDRAANTVVVRAGAVQPAAATPPPPPPPATVA